MPVWTGRIDGDSGHFIACDYGQGQGEGASRFTVAFQFFLGLGIEALRVKDPNNRVSGPNYYNLTGIWALKPYYLGPWTLREGFGEFGAKVLRGVVWDETAWAAGFSAWDVTPWDLAWTLDP